MMRSLSPWNFFPSETFLHMSRDVWFKPWSADCLVLYTYDAPLQDKLHKCEGQCLRAGYAFPFKPMEIKIIVTWGKRTPHRVEKSLYDMWICRDEGKYNGLHTKSLKQE